jgi:hypothetical protein
MKQKEIRKQLNNAREEIFKENEGFHDAIVAKYVTKESKTKSRIKPFHYVAIALTIVIIAVSLVFFLPQNDAPHYLSENEEGRKISLMEANEKLEHIFVEINAEEYASEIYEYYDKLSEDTLYFNLIISNDYEIATMYIYTNEYYTSREEAPHDYTEYKLDSCNVKLYEEVTGDNNFKIYSDIAQIEFSDIEMYITYQEMSISEDSSFFKFFEKTIKTK